LAGEKLLGIFPNMNKQSDTPTKVALSTFEKDIVRTLLYFDIFSYPLRASEIQTCSKLSDHNPEKLMESLNRLQLIGILFQSSGFYSVRQNAENLCQRRIEGNLRAKKFQKIAHRVSRLIAAFPFVRAVFLSGSISKDFMAEDSDIDYFIVTKPGRLWLARTLLVAFKKLFLLNSHKYFCVNYFVDTDNLQIEERNLFTATELVFLIPTYGPDIYSEFRAQNQWSDAYYPHFPFRNTQNLPGKNLGLLKRLTERLFAGSWGESMDRYFMERTIRHWDNKFKQMSRAEFDVALKSRKYVSKHHPNHFQRRVLDTLAMKIREFEKKSGFSLAENTQ
jgi:hypothetical protein